MGQVIFLILMSLNAVGEERCGFRVHSDKIFRLQHPIVYELNKTMQDKHFSYYLQTIKEAALVWNEAIGAKYLIISEDLVDQTDISQGNPLTYHNIIYYQMNWPVEPNVEALNYKRIFNSNQLYGGNIALNAQNYDFTPKKRASRNKIDLKSIMVHEFGHSLGLIDLDVPRSVMHKQLLPNEIRRSLSKLDIMNINCGFNK